MDQAGADGKPDHVVIVEFTDILNNNEEFVRFSGEDIDGDFVHFPGWCGWYGLVISGAYTLAGICRVSLEGFPVDGW